MEHPRRRLLRFQVLGQPPGGAVPPIQEATLPAGFGLNYLQTGRYPGIRCTEAGVRPSVGSVGDAYDNAMAESFFSNLKAELLSRCRFASQAGARMSCFSYIED